MISIDSLTKVKVITKEPGTAEGSSMLNEKGSTILLMTKEPGTAEGPSKLNVKGLTIVQSKKATVETHPTQKTITSSGKVTGARPPLKYIISKGQGGGVASGAVNCPRPLRLITAASQGLSTNTSAATAKPSTITHLDLRKSGLNNDAKPTETTQTYIPNVLPSAGTAPSKASDVIVPSGQLDKKDKIKARKSPTPTKLPPLLPDGYDYHHSTRKLRNSSSQKVHIRVASQEQLKEWFDKYQSKTSTTWRVAKTYPLGDNRTAYKVDYRCHHNTKPRSETADRKRSSKNTQCPASATLCLRRKSDLNPKRSTEEFIVKGYLGSCTFSHQHNHSPDSADSVRHRAVSAAVDESLRKLYEAGHSPGSASDFIQSEIYDNSTNEEYLVKSADRALCPDIGYFYRYYYKMFKTEHDEKSSSGILQSLQSNITRYNLEQFGTQCAVTGTFDDKPVVAICTPVMQRVHKLCPSSGELVFIDSSGYIDKDKHRVFMLMTPSAGGGLPLGCFITSSESEKAISYGLELLTSIIETPFYGKGYPAVFMTDDCAAEKNAIKRNYSYSKHMLCTFHVLRALWRWLHDSTHRVSLIHRQGIMQMVKNMMYATSKEYLSQQFEKLFELSHVADNAALAAHLKRLYERREEWCLCYASRSHYGNDSNTRTESGCRIFKERIFHRVKSYNLTQLTDFIVRRWSAHYVQKLLDISNNRYMPYMYGLPSYPSSDIGNEDVAEVLTEEGIRSEVYQVSAEYLVDMEAGICSCKKGLTGAMCPHQHACAKFYEWSCLSTLPYYNTEQRQLYLHMATGDSSHSLHDALLLLSPSSTECNTSAPPPPKRFKGASASHPATTTKAALSNQKLKEDLIKRIEKFSTSLKSLANNDDFVQPISTFLRSYENIRTKPHLSSALFTFGNTSSSVTARTLPIVIDGGRTKPTL